MARRGLVVEPGGTAFLRALGLVALAALLASACSLDYGTPLSDDFGEDVPDTVVFGFSHTVVENGSPRFKLEADRGEAYQSLKLLKLTAVRFVEYKADGSGAVNADGKAESAVFHTDTESAELSGSVRFHSTGDAMTVESGYLSWDGEAKELASRAETVTTLRDDDGTWLSGSGFTADAKRRSFRFGNRADGRYVTPKDEP
ncbi:MAG: LPS export ABC transporter periplasmic protein LptC [Spirochaetae bacterium HGW-Spirochaetae-7]|jgi:LPS export ABC transporter protein LptC|nr:MAG: LPS export ABC transporter periplasmic protein LptC [Spirochaetae bacterium HGW-Spirochaetae-7]